MADYIASLGYVVDTAPLKRGERALNDVTKAGNKTESSITGLNKSIGVLQAGIAALAGSAVIGGLIKYSDAWNRIDNQLRVVIDSEEELIQKREMLIKLSKDTNASLDSTVALYAELYRNTRQLGTSEEDLSSVTKTLNNLFVAGGKDAQTQASAIKQLSQALGAGALRGQDYNSVVDAAPRVLDALSQSLKIAKGEVRDFAATGGITAEKLIDALTKYDSQAQKMADATIKTFEQYMQNAETNLLTFVSQSEAMLSVTDALGSGIESISENLDALSAAFKAGASVIAASMIPAVVKYTVSMWASVAAQLAATPAVTAYNATLMKTVVITEATTVATNALTLATRVLLGPWGLLATALGVAATAFSITKYGSDDLTKSLKDQGNEADKLAQSLNYMNKQQIADLAIKSQFELINAKNKLFDAELRLQNLMFDTSASVWENKAAASNVEKHKQEVERLQGVLQKIEDLRTGSKSTTTGSDSEKYQEQIASLKQLKQEIGMSSDALFIFREQQKSIARGDTAEATAEIERQAKAVVALRKAEEDRNSMFTAETVDTYALDQSKDYDKWIESIYHAANQAQYLEAEMSDVWDAMLGNDVDWEVGLKRIKQLQDEIKSIEPPKVDTFGDIAQSAKDGLSSIQSLYAQGSKDYQKLGVAVNGLNAVMAVTAVLNQAKGDPYSAPARMAAMASMVASLGAFGVSLAAISGGLSDDSVKNQANQGLTVWGDKSESISKAIKNTEDATSKLVGINTNMLSALKDMAQGLSNASALIVRDAGTSQFSGVNVNENFWDNFGFLNDFTKMWNKTMRILNVDFFNIGGFIFKTIGKFLGGSSKVTDEGIQIVGGAINDVIDNTMVYAFQDVKYKKWRFGGTRRKTQMNDISDQVGGQLGLVFESLVDSVVSAAEAIGINDSSIQSRINAFNIETTKISLKGLSAKDQQAEIESVFSKIFDNLAIAVVPFADEFQKVGEGMGETLVRLATQMQVTEKASQILGFSFGNASAEINAFVSDALSNLVGGVSNLASLTSSFIDKFATDEQKLAVNSQALNDALRSVGLSVPATAQGFYDLMGILDANTAAGREQIATLLNIQDVASEYYDLLDDSSSKLSAANSEFNALTANLRGMVISMYDLGDASSQVSLDMALAAARSGDFSLAKSFSGVNIDQSDFSSRSAYEIAQAQAANKISELADLTESQVTVEERQLNKLEEINKELIKQKEDLETMRYANQTTAKNSEKSLKLMQQMVGYGINVTVVE